MKSILQNIALLSSILLIASCDSGGGGGVADIGVTLPTPTNGATGSAVKGVISGGNITVTDANGATVSLASGTTTNADGSYRLIFTEAEINAGIAAPLIVTISGGNGATMVCDIDNANTTDDCPVGDGTFAAFGASYTLPADFELSGIIAEIPADNPNADPVVNINVNPATDLAAAFAKAAAGTSALTATDVTTATTAVLGLVQQITGVNLAGQDLNAITIPNIAGSTAGASDLGLALASFAAAVIADQGANESVSAAIARIKASVSVDANGNITGTGTNLGRIASAVAKALAVVNEKSGGTNAAIANAISNANSNAATLTNQGNNTAVIAKPPVPGSTEPADLTKTLVANISDVITNIVATTGAAGFGVTGAGETEAFATELNTVRVLTDADATAAFNQLSAAAKEAFASGGGEDTDATDGVTGTMTIADGVVTVTNATSTSGNVTITVESGTSNGDTFEITGVTMVSKNAAGDTIQTFTGSIGEVAGTTSGHKFYFDGSVVGAGTPSFSINLTADNVVDGTDGNKDGTYSATLAYDGTNDLSITLSGTIGANPLAYSITAGSKSISGTVTRTDTANGGYTDVDTITDGNGATLTINVSNGNVVVGENNVIGTFTVNGTATATLDNNGVVTYTDGSVQALPARIF